MAVLITCERAAGSGYKGKWRDCACVECLRRQTMSTPLDRHIDGIMKYPETARQELQWIYANMHRLKTLDGEVAVLRTETKKHRVAARRYEKKLNALQLAYDQECLRARKATSALELAEDMKVRIRSLADMESRKAREAEAKAEAEKLRANHLQKQVLKLERALREARRDGANGKLTSAIRKITTYSAVGKRLAAALHPDKVPPELSDVATEVFQFIQGLRDNAG